MPKNDLTTDQKNDPSSPRAETEQIAALHAEIVRLSACDPLNLVGILTPGPRVPATLANTVIFVDGVPQTEPSFVESRAAGGAGARSWSAAAALEQRMGSSLADTERPI